jgi:hypothetical protein
MKNIIFLIVFLFSFNAYAQKHQMGFNIGTLGLAQEKAMGHYTTLAYVKENKKSSFYANFTLSFADGRGSIFNEADAPYNFLHDPYQNYVWGEPNGWPGRAEFRVGQTSGFKSLSFKPNRYRIMDLSIGMQKKAWSNNKWQLNLGGGISIAHIYYGKIIDKFKGTLEFGFYAPTEMTYYVHRYNRFIDAGISTKADLLYHINDTWDLCFPLQATYYPISRFDMIQLGAGLRFKM